MKRLMDVSVALILLIALAPLLLLIALLIRIDSPGSPVFSQIRIGLGGCEFRLYKFRSMVTDAEKIGPYYSTQNDPRITRIGQVLRKTSLDELPQLINVLRGDMSLVGPRPDVPAQRDNYTEQEWALRTSVRPGITGLAQATLRSSASAEERTRLDLEYVSMQSVAVDVWIVGLTVRQVLGRGGH